MPKVLHALRRMLAAPRFLAHEPVRVYAVALRYGLEDLAREAAAHALRFPVDWPNYEEFKDVSEYDYHMLLSLHRERARGAVACLAHPSVLTSLGTC
ncbi:hypothetical protein SCP_1502940 [Sparassis crispa]|uniref:Uncharacterized protein n=1 Tax=Sparassis crispa TaxID=139825 RepID=A0A401H4B4_9APHY|nr:hypothetical protein SCP_1502940 [Sparassis crispa]GBE89286.1 hypothetical protein SCP_1502940 [Sparassis crispa]